MDHSGSAGSDAVRMQPAESTNDGAIAPASGPSTARLGDSFYFKAELSGPEAPGTVGVAEAGHDPLLIIHHENAAPAGGSLPISEQTQTIAPPPAWHDASDKFSAAADHAAPVVVTHVFHDLMV
jgi:hypothetical protein